MKGAPFSSLRICFVANGVITLVIITLHFVHEHINLLLESFLMIEVVQSMDWKLWIYTAI
jgi:hypothetical protein